MSIGLNPMNATASRSGAGLTGNKIPKGNRMGQMQNFTPEQMQLFQQMFGQLGPESFLGKLAGGDQSQFAEMEAPAMQQFNEMQGQLGSRFSDMGQGARKSSGFQNTMNQATSDFAQQLQSQRLGIRNQAIKDLMGMSNDLLGQRPYTQFMIEKQKPWWQQFLLNLNEKGQEFAGAAAKGAMSGGF